MKPDGTGRTILHVDMDAFFASVEAMDDPSLKGKALIVGRTPAEHGVVAAASYEARKYGIHSAMPTARALSLCPHAILVPPRGRRYGEMSGRIMAILREFTPVVEQVSVDEAYMDVTGSEALFGNGEAIARKIRERVRKETGLTCSIGVAPNRFLAKLASDLDKPDGLTVVPVGNEEEFIAPLPVDRIPGVGARTAESLAALGIRTIGALARFPAPRLRAALGSSAEHLKSRARGEGSAEIDPVGSDPKSISRESTFAVFLAGREEASWHLLELADSVARRLRREGFMAAQVTLKVRDDRFATVTRSRSLPAPTDLAEAIYGAVEDMLKDRVVLRGRRIRLLGVATSSLVAREAVPAELFPDPGTDRARRAAETVDRIKNKMGKGAVTRGGLLRK